MKITLNVELTKETRQTLANLGYIITVVNNGGFGYPPIYEIRWGDCSD